MPAFKLLFLHGKCPSPYSIVSLPRRSTSSFILNQQSSSPRHPVTFYVDVHSGVNSLEHLLVYTPSGYVIKLELLPSIEAELNESDLATRSGSYRERKECFSETTFDAQLAGENKVSGDKSDSVKLPERSHLYLSNAKVQIMQINSGWLPIWPKSKIHFGRIIPPRVDRYNGGEFEIYKVLIASKTGDTCLWCRKKERGIPYALVFVEQIELSKKCLMRQRTIVDLMLQCIHQFSTACCCDLALVLRFQWAVLMARCHWIVTLGLETQMLSIPAKCQGNEGLRRSHPRRFYGVSIGALRFQSAVLMVRCSHRIVALGLEMQ
ncbi:unnamed protein product, partial [Ilex paraguariensis]